MRLVLAMFQKDEFVLKLDPECLLVSHKDEHDLPGLLSSLAHLSVASVHDLANKSRKYKWMRHIRVY